MVVAVTYPETKITREVQLKETKRKFTLGIMKGGKSLTNGGRQSSACLRRTEKPPWVLVSEAVSVLQNEWILTLGDSVKGSSGLVTSLC